MDSAARKAGRGQPQRCLATTLSWDSGVASVVDIGLRRNQEGLVQSTDSENKLSLQNSRYAKLGSIRRSSCCHVLVAGEAILPRLESRAWPVDSFSHYGRCAVAAAYHAI